MRKIFIGLFAFMALTLVFNPQVFGHTLFMMVEDNEDETVTVKGVVLWKGKTDDDGECTFKKAREKGPR